MKEIKAIQIKRKIHKKSSIIAVFFSLPWCCILPAIFSLLGLISGIGAARIWSIKFTPILFIFSLLFLARAHWLLYGRHQDSLASAILVWISTVFVSILWILRFRSFLRLIALSLVSILIFTSHLALAHEPIFSLGPETIYKGGIGIESEVEYEKGGSDRETAIHYEIIYGVTEDLSLTIEVPHIIEKKEGGEISDGLGEVALRGKYQLFRKDTLGAQDKAALIYGLKFPTGDEDKDPSLGSGSWDHLFGLSIGHESTTLYGFATGRYVLKTESGGKEKGDQVLIDVAFGFRPWLRSYKSWDLVLLLENSYICLEKDEVNGIKQANSGGEEIFIGPTLLWSIRNIMIKGGIQFPVWQDLNGNQKRDFRSLLAVEYHF